MRGIAANEVMAGCRPEYMPVLLAAVEAIGDPTTDKKINLGRDAEEQEKFSNSLWRGRENYRPIAVMFNFG